MKRMIEASLFIFAILVAAVVVSTRFPTQGTYAQAAPPRVTIQADASQTPAQLIPMSATSTPVFSFTISNLAAESVRLNTVTVFVSSTPANANTRAVPTLLNYRLINAATGRQIASTVSSAFAGPAANLGRISWNPYLIMSASSTTGFIVKVDAQRRDNGAISGSLHQFMITDEFGPSWPALNAVGTSSGLNASRSGSVYGATHAVYAVVIRAGLHASSPRGLQSSSPEQLVARFKLWKTGSDARIPYVAGQSSFSLHSTINNGSPRMLNVYRDSFVAANRIGSVSVPAGPMNRWVNVDLSRFEVPNATGSPKLLIVTLDTSDARVNNTLQINLENITWSDTVTPRISGLQEQPVQAYIISY